MNSAEYSSSLIIGMSGLLSASSQSQSFGTRYGSTGGINLIENVIVKADGLPGLGRGVDFTNTSGSSEFYSDSFVVTSDSNGFFMIPYVFMNIIVDAQSAYGGGSGYARGVAEATLMVSQLDGAMAELSWSPIISSVPEPSSLVLVCLGGLGLAFGARRRRVG